jgi:hypothetical protein
MRDRAKVETALALVTLGGAAAWGLTASGLGKLRVVSNGPSSALAQTDAAIPFSHQEALATFDAGVADARAMPLAGAADIEADGGTPAPRPLQITAHALTDGGVRTLSSANPTEEVPVEARFEVEVPRLSDVRVRLFDDVDKLVPSSDRLESREGFTRYNLTPVEALAPGSRYSILLDGQRAEQPTDLDGNAHEVVRLELRTAGQKVVPEKHLKKATRRRRR